MSLTSSLTSSLRKKVSPAHNSPVRNVASPIRSMDIMVADGLAIDYPTFKAADPTDCNYLNVTIGNKTIRAYFGHVSAPGNQTGITYAADAVLRRNCDMHVFGKPNIIINDESPELYLRTCILEVLCARGYHCAYTDIDIGPVYTLGDFLDEFAAMVRLFK